MILEQNHIAVGDQIIITYEGRFADRFTPGRSLADENNKAIK